VPKLENVPDQNMELFSQYYLKCPSIWKCRIFLGKTIEYDVFSVTISKGLGDDTLTNQKRLF